MYRFPRFNLFECLESRERRKSRETWLSQLYVWISLTFAFAVGVWPTPRRQHQYFFILTLSLSLERYIWKYDASMMLFRRHLLIMSSTFRLLLYHVQSGTGRGGGSLWRAADKQTAGGMKWMEWWRAGRRTEEGDCRRAVAGAGRRLRADGQAIAHRG